MGERFRFTSPLWEWQARANWFFLSVPAEQAAEIDDRPRMPRGFDSVPVMVTIGGSTWKTSIFPGADSYSLPVKAQVRRAEGIAKGDTVTAEIELL